MYWHMQHLVWKVSLIPIVLSIFTLLTQAKAHNVFIKHRAKVQEDGNTYKCEKASSSIVAKSNEEVLSVAEPCIQVSSMTSTMQFTAAALPHTVLTQTCQCEPHQSTAALQRQPEDTNYCCRLDNHSWSKNCTTVVYCGLGLSRLRPKAPGTQSNPTTLGCWRWMNENKVKLGQN